MSWPRGRFLLNWRSGGRAHYEAAAPLCVERAMRNDRLSRGMLGRDFSSKGPLALKGPEDGPSGRGLDPDQAPSPRIELHAPRTDRGYRRPGEDKGTPPPVKGAMTGGWRPVR